jgi:hypothetical protein
MGGMQLAGYAGCVEHPPLVVLKFSAQWCCKIQRSNRESVFAAFDDYTCKMQCINSS